MGIASWTRHERTARQRRVATRRGGVSTGSDPASHDVLADILADASKARAAVVVESDRGTVLHANAELAALVGAGREPSDVIGGPMLALEEELERCVGTRDLGTRAAALREARKPSLGVPVRFADARSGSLDYVPVLVDGRPGHLWQLRCATSTDRTVEPAQTPAPIGADTVAGGSALPVSDTLCAALELIASDLIAPVARLADAGRSGRPAASDADAVEPLVALADATRSLELLLADLRELATERVDQEPVAVDLDRTVGRGLQRLRVVAAGRNVAVVADVASGARVVGRVEPIELMIDNVLASSLERCDAGGAMVVATSRRDGEAYVDVRTAAATPHQDRAASMTRAASRPTPVRDGGLGGAVVDRVADQTGASVAHEADEFGRPSVRLALAATPWSERPAIPEWNGEPPRLDALG